MGVLSVGMGLVLGLLALACAWSERPAARAVLALGYGALALLQGLPIVLWFLFHGSGISDGSPPSSFVAHWGFSLPHIALLAVSLGVVHLARRQP